MTKEELKELPKIRDLSSQVLLHIKHLAHGFSEFNGQMVMEDGEETELTQSIEEALKQYGEYTLDLYKKELMEKVKGIKKEEQGKLLSIMPEKYWKTEGHNQALNEVISIINE